MRNVFSHFLSRMEPQKLRWFFAFSFQLLSFVFFLCPSYSLFLVVFYGLFLPSGLLMLLKEPPLWLNALALQMVYAFLAYSAMTLFFNVNSDPRWCLDLLAKTVLTALFLVLAFAFFKVSENTERYLRYTTWWTLIGSLASIGNYFGNHKEWLRLAPLAQAHNPILGANIYGLFSLFALYRLLKAPLRHEKVIAGLALTGSAMLIVLTQSKGPLIAVLFSYLLMAIIFLCKTRKYWMMALLLLALPLIATATMQAQMPQSPTKDRSYIENLAARGLSYRPQIWAYTLHKIAEHPLFGHGLGAPFEMFVAPGVAVRHPHNLYLATLYYTGIIGFLLEMGLFAIMIRAIAHDPNTEWKKLASVIVLYMMLSMASDVVRLVTSPKELMLLFWLPFSMVVARDAKGRNDS